MPDHPLGQGQGQEEGGGGHHQADQDIASVVVVKSQSPVSGLGCHPGPDGYFPRGAIMLFPDASHSAMIPLLCIIRGTI